MIYSHKYNMLQVLNESLSLLLVFIVGAFAFHYMDLFGRILFYQLAIWIEFYLLSYIVTSYQLQQGTEQNNLWVMNASVFIEIIFLARAGYELMKTPKKKYLLVCAICLFVIMFAIEIGYKGVDVFANYSYIFGSLLLVITFSFALYIQMGKGSPVPKTSPEMWMCLGILLYFTCGIPYLSLVNYLNANHPGVSTFLFHLINDGLANIRYLLLAVGFWLIRRNAVLLKSRLNEL
jgi:hypothetical protein